MASRLSLKLALIILSAVALPRPAVGLALDGAWRDPAHSGEGWIVEVLPDDTAVVYWFTYPPSGGSGTQAWIQGVGRVAGDTLEITESVRVRGPAFGAGFNPQDLQREPWGTWTMRFTDCKHGTLLYDGPPGFGDGEFTIERLSRLQGSECTEAAPHDPAGTGFSGSWLDPETSGQGITLEILADGLALLYWFTFTPAGEQAWVYGVGRATGPRIEFSEVFMPVGTVFGGGFDPTAINQVPWGAGSMPLVRLTELARHPCQLPAAPPLSKGHWASALNMSPPVSELATAVLDGRAYTAGDFGSHPRAFLRFNPATGGTQRLPDLPEPRNHAMMAALRGELYVFGGYDGLSFIATDTVWQYSPARNRWIRFTTMPGAMAAAAAVSLGDFIYVITRNGFIWRLDVDAKEWTIFPGPGTVNRDHANAVAFRGEIWWLAGRGGNAQGQFRSLRSVDIFDPVTGVWRPGPSLSHGHSGFAAAVVQGQIMVAGGEHPGATLDLWTLEPSLEVYSARAGHWRPGPAVPVPVHGVGGAALNGRFYLLGGSTLPGGADNPGIIQIYDPDSGS